MNTCKTCKYFDKPLESLGKCLLISDSDPDTDSFEVDDTTRKASLAYTIDVYGNDTSLIVDENFGCIQHINKIVEVF